MDGLQDMAVLATCGGKLRMRTKQRTAGPRTRISLRAPLVRVGKAGNRAPSQGSQDCERASLCEPLWCAFDESNEGRERAPSQGAQDSERASVAMPFWCAFAVMELSLWCALSGRESAPSQGCRDRERASLFERLWCALGMHAMSQMTCPPVSGSLARRKKGPPCCARQQGGLGFVCGWLVLRSGQGA